MEIRLGEGSESAFTQLVDMARTGVRTVIAGGTGGRRPRLGLWTRKTNLQAFEGTNWRGWGEISRDGGHYDGWIVVDFVGARFPV